MSAQVASVDDDGLSERVKQLCRIDNDIVDLLKHAGNAIKALTQSPATLEASDHNDFAERRSQFAEAASAYFNTLSSINVNMRRQIRELKRMDIIPSEEAPFDKRNGTEDQVQLEFTDAMMPAQRAMRKNPITAGGLGHLDIGWLNSKNYSIGKQSEAGLWEEALQNIKSYEAQKDRNHTKEPSPSASPGPEARDLTEPMDEG